MTPISCPNCCTRLEVPEREIGHEIRCFTCHTHFVAEDSPVLDLPGPPSPTNAPSGTARRLGAAFEHAPPTGVSLLLAGGVAALVTFALYAFLIPAIAGTYLGGVLSRGWVSATIVLLTVWSILMLGNKSVKLRGERKAFGLDVLPASIGAQIDRGNVDQFRDHVAGLAEKPGGGFLLSRTLRALDFFRYRGSAHEVAELLAVEADKDEAAVESTFTMPKVFIWAIPILGFVGTVLGISQAVGSFSETIAGAGSLPEMKTTLGGVTQGLGVAFDTTLVALCVSIVLMVATNWCQKSELELLSGVSAFCNEQVLLRLDDRKQGTDPDALVERLERVVEAGVTRLCEAQEAAMFAWAEKFRVAGDALSAQMREQWSRTDERMGERQQQQMEQAAVVHKDVIERVDARAGQWIAALGEGIDRGSDVLAQRWQGANEALRGQLEKIHEALWHTGQQISAERDTLVGAVVPGVEVAAKALAAAPGAISQVVQDSNAEHRRSLKALLSEFTSAVEAMSAATFARAETHAARFDEVQRETTDRSVQTAAHLAHAAGDIAGSVAGFREAADRIVAEAAAGASRVAATERVVAEGAREQREHLESATGTLSETLAKVVSTTETMQERFDADVTALLRRQEETAGRLQTAANALEGLTTHVADTVSERVSERLAALRKGTTHRNRGPSRLAAMLWRGTGRSRN